MCRPVARSIATAAALAAFCLVDGNNWFERLTPPLLAQQGIEKMPGPIIEDPPGPYHGNSYVPASKIATEPLQALSTFIVTYNGFTPEAQAAFQAAVDVWASQIQSSVPIRVIANWTALAPDVLGSAESNYITHDFPGAVVPNTWFAAALANKMAGTDLFPLDHDINASFNSNLNWYYGTDGNAGSNFDLMSVVLHELAHGLGFFGSMKVSTVNGSWGFGSGLPAMYDRFAINGSSQLLINTALYPNPGLALGAQLVSNVFFGGTNARNGNGGSAAKLYTPSVWQQGSSYSHLNESTFPAGNSNSLMTPLIGPGEAIHDTGSITRGIFTDSGWGPVVNCTYALSSTSLGIGVAAGVGSVNVFAPAGCAWAGVSNATFITINPGSASGNGNGTVNFTFSANSGGPRSGTLTIAGQTFTVTQAARALTGDFDGDRKSDVTVFRPSTGIWYVRNVVTGLFEFYQWGLNGDIPVQGDYDGDGKADVAVFRPSTSIWYIRNSSAPGAPSFLQWGLTGDIPVPGDYDGDGKTDAAVFRPSTGIWYVRDLATNTASFYQWGLNGDIPVPGDYDGDGKTDVAVWRPSTGIWYIRNSSDGSQAFLQWGLTGDIPVPGDYDGDGKTDAAVFRPSTGIWYVRDLATNTASFYQWGLNGDVPVSGDFDGDGKTDIAVFRPSTSIWYVRPSGTPGAPGFYQWGITGDIPILKP